MLACNTDRSPSIPQRSIRRMPAGFERDMPSYAIKKNRNTDSGWVSYVGGDAFYTKKLQ